MTTEQTITMHNLHAKGVHGDRIDAEKTSEYTKNMTLREQRAKQNKPRDSNETEFGSYVPPSKCQEGSKRPPANAPRAPPAAPKRFASIGKKDVESGEP